MNIGIDFDNTITCYDQIFHRAALEQAWISADTPQAKDLVRDEMRRRGLEEKWIELQGLVYGARMNEAPPYEGVLDFISQAKSNGCQVSVVSHRTRHPFRGVPYDLHKTAYNWLKTYGFFDAEAGGGLLDQVYFELTKAEKLERIGKVGCDVFIDDLPEFLGEPNFPRKTKPILFDPNNKCPQAPFSRARAWKQMWGLLQ